LRRALLVAGLALAVGAHRSPAQAPTPRSADYLLTATVEDARALWLNPAGLAIVPEASILAEIVAEQPPGGNPRVSQWTVGFNSRGVAIGYQRNRIPDDPATIAVDPQSAEVFRIGLALPFRAGALGGSFSLHHGSTGTDKSGDIGLRLHPRPSIDLSVVLRDIGRPRVAGDTVPVSGVFGVGWLVSPRHVEFGADVVATERLGPASGFTMGYRLASRVSTGGRLPVGGLVMLELTDRLTVSQLSFGIAIGGEDRAIVVGTVTATDSGRRLDQLSLTGVASRAPVQPRP
jgi:hypothetical protein